jgi:hypothetical protein
VQDGQPLIDITPGRKQGSKNRREDLDSRIGHPGQDSNEKTARRG